MLAIERPQLIDHWRLAHFSGQLKRGGQSLGFSAPGWAIPSPTIQAPDRKRFLAVRFHVGHAPPNHVRVRPLDVWSAHESDGQNRVNQNATLAVVCGEVLGVDLECAHRDLASCGKRPFCLTLATWSTPCRRGCLGRYRPAPAPPPPVTREH